jgi:hypothetical protein
MRIVTQMAALKLRAYRRITRCRCPSRDGVRAAVQLGLVPLVTLFDRLEIFIRRHVIEMFDALVAAAKPVCLLSSRTVHTRT